MSLSRKFIIVLITSIIFIAIVNVIAFYVFYDFYRKVYLAERIELKNNITIEYINKVIEKQTIDDIDNIFNNTEIEFFELLENNKWEIPLDKEKNVNIVINYLIKSWVAPKYIEEIIPSDSFEKVLYSFKDKNSPEYFLIKRISKAIVYTNIITIFFIILWILIFTRKIILPIKEVTRKISNLKPWNSNVEIKYTKKDEVGLLINAINWLNKKLNIQEWIRNRLLADISHELKTPITSIQCYLEWISDWVIKLDSRNLEAITDEMKRLIELVNRIMDYEKFERKKLKLDKKDVNVTNLLKLLVETHKKRLKENKQRIKISGIEECIINLDKDLFTQIVHNVIWNFLKYAGKNTILKINITKNYLDFTDDWKWIKSKEIPFLTDKFYQWNKWKSWYVKKRWIWVWLSIVKKIIKAHDWDVSIKSEEWKFFSFKIYV